MVILFNWMTCHVRPAISTFIMVLLFLSTISAVPTPNANAIGPTSEVIGENQHYAYKTTKWVLPFLKDDGVSGPFALFGKDRFMAISRCGTETTFSRHGEMFSEDVQSALPTPEGLAVACDFHDPYGGVKGLRIDEERATAYASYQTRPSPGCLKLAVVAYRFDGRLSDPRAIFVSDPCYPEKYTVLTQAGGAFAQHPDGTLFFSVSDFGSHEDPQKPTTSYGKIYFYNVVKKTVGLWALGVRNAEGLAWANGELYETEHGPKGGDELNVVREGDNLGWPLGSY